MRRLAVLAAVAAALTVVSAPAASAQTGAPGFEVDDGPGFVVAKGPGLRVFLSRASIHTIIIDDQFGIPSAGFPIERTETDLGNNPSLRPIVCENGTYRIQSGIFEVTRRTSSTELRPPPYPPDFGVPPLTFVGTLDAVVTNERGERHRLLMTDLVHDVLTADSFASTAPIHAFITDRFGRVRDRASLTGLFNSSRDGGDARFVIEDRGTCRQTANLGPGAEEATVFGPFFVFPFNAPVVER